MSRQHKPIKEPTPSFICECCGKEFDCVPHVMDGVEGWLRINGMHFQSNRNLLRFPENFAEGGEG
tara:strand:+ start:739 stop:933 length:195 start_codon:yes stop_codon:yes gene_type:complete